MKPLYPIGSPVIILQWKNNIFLKDLFSSEISRFLFYFLISLFFFIVALKIFLNKQFHKKTYTKESQVAEWEQKIDSLPNTQDNKKVSLLLIWIPI